MYQIQHVEQGRMLALNILQENEGIIRGKSLMTDITKRNIFISNRVNKVCTLYICNMNVKNRKIEENKATKKNTI